MKKRIASVLCILLLFLAVTPVFSAFAASGPSVRTTLIDNAIQNGSRKTFDVWARNGAGKKINATVTFNGVKIFPTWNDNDKASYTLIFTKEGNNTVVVSATSDGGRKKQCTYNITYEKVRDGEPIGKATWSIEIFSIGCGYLISPTEIDIYDGETSADQLIRLLHNNGFVSYYSGTTKSAFYLGYIADGTAANQKYNNYQKSGNAKNPQKLNITPSIPSMLIEPLSKTMTFFDPQDYLKNWNGYLGEFVITNGSGWMYSVNNIFPNVGFADTYLSDGDVVRVQFTLGYGADIGGFGAMGSSIPDVETQPTSGYYLTANKDALTKAICRANASGYLKRANVNEAYNNALLAAETLNASQNAVDSAVNLLNYALDNPSKEATSTASTTKINSTIPSTNKVVTTSKKYPVVNSSTTTRVSTTTQKAKTTKAVATTKAITTTRNSIKTELAVTEYQRYTYVTEFSRSNNITTGETQAITSAKEQSHVSGFQIETNPVIGIDNQDQTIASNVSVTDSETVQSVTSDANTSSQHVTSPGTFDNTSEVTAPFVIAELPSNSASVHGGANDNNRILLISVCVVILVGAACYVYFRKRKKHEIND